MRGWVFGVGNDNKVVKTTVSEASSAGVPGLNVRPVGGFLG
jgi:hypothetical protein